MMHLYFFSSPFFETMQTHHTLPLASSAVAAPDSSPKGAPSRVGIVQFRAASEGSMAGSPLHIALGRLSFSATLPHRHLQSRATSHRLP